MGEVDHFQCSGHATPPLTTGDLAIQQRYFDVFRYVQIVDQVEILKDKADASAAAQGELCLRALGDIRPHEPVQTGAWAGDQTEDIEERRLAAAGRTHDREELASLNLQRQIVERRGFHV